MKKLFKTATAFALAAGIFIGFGETESKADYIIGGQWWTNANPIGHLTLLKDIKLYKRGSDWTIQSFIGKKGTKYPVYGIQLPTEGWPQPMYYMGGEIRGITHTNLVKYENIQASYIVRDGPDEVYTKVWGKPYEWVYVNLLKDGKWVKTEKLQLDQYGFLRSPHFDIKSYSPGSWQSRVYYFSDKKTVWTKKLEMGYPPEIIEEDPAGWW